MSALPASDLFGYAERYPSVPGFKRTETSAAAAESIAPKAPRLRQMCLDTLKASGPLTADECAARLGIDRLSIRPRFSELSAEDKIADTGIRHCNSSGRPAIVWRYVP